MDYEKIYSKLIYRGQVRVVEFGTYYEAHHIVPRCIGGTDHYSNIVRLTVKEHVFAHILLYKMYREDYPTLVFAIWAFYEDANKQRHFLRKKPVWIARWIRKQMGLHSKQSRIIANRIKCAELNRRRAVHQNPRMP